MYATMWYNRRHNESYESGEQGVIIDRLGFMCFSYETIWSILEYISCVIVCLNYHIFYILTYRVSFVVSNMAAADLMAARPSH